MNNVSLLGRLGKIPEIRKTNSGFDVANIRLATSEKIKGEEKTQWHNVVVFGKVVEFLGSLATGDQLAVDGKITYRKYEAKTGETKYITEIVANKIHFISNKKQQDNFSGQDNTELYLEDVNITESIPF